MLGPLDGWDATAPATAPPNRTILHAYELVSEAYQQRFRKLRNSDQETYVEFTREKERTFDRLCVSHKVVTRKDLKQLVLIEELKNRLPQAVAICSLLLNEQKLLSSLMTTHSLTSRSVTGVGVATSIELYQPTKENLQRRRSKGSWSLSVSPPGNLSRIAVPRKELTCFYCKKPGHKVAECNSH